MFSISLSPSTSAFAGDPALGAAEMRQLRREFPGDGLREVVAMFQEEGQLKLDQIARAVAGRDAGALRRAAHALQGAAANFGARPLEGLCRKVEGNARRGELDAAASWAAQIPEEYRRVELALEEECRVLCYE